MIAGFELRKNRALVIAEIGNNHNGNLKVALDLVRSAKNSGADIVKFQMRNLDEVYRSRSLSKSGEDLGTEYVIDLLNKFELTVSEHFQIFEFCKEIGIQYLCTPWDGLSVKTLEDFGVPAYKISSADLTNFPLIETVSETGKPLILSTGMSVLAEVESAVAFLKEKSADFALLHCNSTYPAPFDDINLKWMLELQKLHPFIGYSGHERGISVSIAAVALGASIIERHLTFDRTLEGPDHGASLIPEEFSEMVTGIRQIEAALGTGAARTISQGEMINKENLSKSLVAAWKIQAGTKIGRDDIVVKSPGQGLSPLLMSTLIGKTINRDMDFEDFFYDTDIDNITGIQRDFSFKRPWGIPVRYHDFQKFNALVTPDIWEFHLSYTDMDLDLKDFFEGTYEQGLVVHAPELFKNSHLMDLASMDQQYRVISIEQTQKIINLTLQLREFFPNTSKPLIVANVGGFSLDAPLSSEEVLARYQILRQSLAELDLDGVELIPQTMAPFPWHFGGQRYQNLFLSASEIKKYCEELGLRICLDISHSKLACNHFGWDFEEFLEAVIPFTAHIHVGDAKGVNGEGLQVFDGDIDFHKFGKILNDAENRSSFIPEIWQGHKNNGNVFWIALQRLQGIL